MYGGFTICFSRAVNGRRSKCAAFRRSLYIKPCGKCSTGATVDYGAHVGVYGQLVEEGGEVVPHPSMMSAAIQVRAECSISSLVECETLYCKHSDRDVG